jgi:UDP-N-acetylmuramoyl-tripeptide--D-alanyl-D-alanine ligase
VNFWTPDSLRSASGGTFVLRPDPGVVAASPAMHGLSIDSRSILPGQAFMAIRGERFDAHEFVFDVAGSGCPLMFIERDVDLVRLREAVRVPPVVIRVPDARKALARLAHAYRRSLTRTRVIAVCGSNGKTTTVRLIDAVLASRLTGTASRKSFNNDIGVPLTILAASPTDQYLICEVGTNAPGEIAHLAGIVEPDVCVITSIGREHLELLGGLDGVAQEESAIVRGTRPGGLALVIGDSPELSRQVRDGVGGVSVMTFGMGEACMLRVTDARVEADQTGEARGRAGDAALGTSFSLNGRGRYFVPLPGTHNATNAAAAIGVARRLGVDERSIVDALRIARGPEMRWDRSLIRLAADPSRAVEVINDAYNANPESMLASLRTLSAVLAAGVRTRRVIILGEMRELGEGAQALHEEVGREVGTLGLIGPGDALIVVGAMGTHYARAAVAAGVPVTCVIELPDATGEQAARASAMIRPGDTVLLKGSRAVGLERIVKHLAGAVPTIATGAAIGLSSGSGKAVSSAAGASGAPA